MARILTGIQSSGVPHLGNALGAIEPALERAELPENECFYFIADMHSLTSLKDASWRREHIRAVAAAWMALGLDVERHYFYRQSDVPEVTELTWYLSCYTPYPMLLNAHSFKDKQDQPEEVNAGLFTYPVLMAADILLYDAEEVPVGKDQKQHLEMTRDMAGALNHQTGQELLTLPEPRIDEKVMTIPGIDGRKMSKSYGNTIDIFAPSKTLKKQVMRIVTDSRELEESKDPDSCYVFTLYSHLAEGPAIQTMRERYLAGGYGYGHAKKELLRVIHERYDEARERYEVLMKDPDKVEAALEAGARKVRPLAQATLERVRAALGFGTL